MRVELFPFFFLFVSSAHQKKKISSLILFLRTGTTLGITSSRKTNHTFFQFNSRFNVNWNGIMSVYVKYRKN